MLRALSEATWVGDIEQTLPALCRELHADDVALSALSADGTAVETIVDLEHGDRGGERHALIELPATRRVIEHEEAVQVLRSDSGADGFELAGMAAHGYAALLMLPIATGGQVRGLLQLFSCGERAWSRNEVHRARIVGYQLGAYLDSVGRAGVDGIGGRIVHRHDFAQTSIEALRLARAPIARQSRAS